jgi:tetratricopeptide (TPR) repeat protein
MRTLILTVTLVVGISGCASNPEKPDEQPNQVTASGQVPQAKPRDISVEAKKAFAEAVASYQEQRKAGNPDYNALLEKFKAVTDIDSKFAEAYYNLGCIYEALRDDKKAQEQYQKALEVFPQLTLAAANWGALLARHNKLDEALAIYQKALSGDSKNSTVLLNMAAIYKQQKQFDKAAEVASQVLVRDPTNIGAYRIMAAIYYDKGDLDMAHLICERGLKVKEKDPRLLNTLGLILLKKKKVPEALVNFRVALAQAPDMIPTHINVAKIALDYKDFKVARETFQKILEYDPGNKKAAMGIGIAMLGSRDFESAKQQFTKLAEKEPKSAVPHQWLCAVARSANDGQTAMNECQKCIELSGGSLASDHPCNTVLVEIKKNLEKIRQEQEMEKQVEAQAKKMQDMIEQLTKKKQDVIDQEWAKAEQNGDPLPDTKYAGTDVPFVLKPPAVAPEKASKVQLIGAVFENVLKVEIGTMKAKWIQIDETTLEIDVPKGLDLGGWDIMVTFKDKSKDPLHFPNGLWVAKKKPKPAGDKAPAPNATNPKAAGQDGKAGPDGKPEEKMEPKPGAGVQKVEPAGKDEPADSGGTP